MASQSAIQPYMLYWFFHMLKVNKLKTKRTTMKWTEGCEEHEVIIVQTTHGLPMLKHLTTTTKGNGSSKGDKARTTTMRDYWYNGTSLENGTRKKHEHVWSQKKKYDTNKGQGMAYILDCEGNRLTFLGGFWVVGLMMCALHAQIVDIDLNK